MATLSEMLVKLGVDTGDYQSGIDKAIEANKSAKASISEVSDSVKSFMDGLDTDAIQKFGQGLSDDAGRAQALKDEVARANAAVDEFFSGGKNRPPVIPPDTVPQVMNLEQAFGRLGVTSAASLRDTAETSRVAYETIKSSGTASARDIQQAWIAMEEARQRAAIQSGEQISQSEKKTLADAKASVKEMEAGYTAAFQNISEAAQKLGQALGAAGRILTGAITVPLTAISAAAIKVGVDFDAANDHIRAATGATGQALGALDQSFRNVFGAIPTSTKDAAEAISQLSIRTGLTGKALEDLTTQEINLARITDSQVAPLVRTTTELFAKWGIATGDQSHALDFLLKTSQATGIGVTQLSGELVNAGAVLKEVGFSFQQSAALMGQLQKEGIPAASVVMALRTEMVKLSKEGIAPTSDGFKQIVELIKQNALSLDQSKQAWALHTAQVLFGQRAALQMVDAIKAGRLNIDELTGRINASTETVNKAAEDTLSFADKLKLLKQQAELAIEPLGKALIDALTSVMGDMKSVIALTGDAAKGFAAMPAPIRETAIALAALAAVTPVALIGLGSMAVSISRLIELAAKFGVGFASIGPLVANAALAFPAFSAAIAVTMSNLSELEEKWKTFTATTRATDINQLFASGMKASGEMLSVADLQKMGFTLDEIRTALTGMDKAWKDTGLTIRVTTTDAAGHVKVLGGAHDSLRGAIDKLTQTNKDHVLSLSELVAKQKELQAASEVAQGVYKKAVDQFGKDSDEAALAYKQMVKANKAALVELDDAMTMFVTATKAKFSSLSEMAQKFVVDQRVIEKQANDAAKAYEELRKAFEGGKLGVDITDVKRSFDELVKLMKQAGININDLGVTVHTIAEKHVPILYGGFERINKDTGGWLGTVLQINKAITDQVSTSLPALTGGVLEVGKAWGKAAGAAGDHKTAVEGTFSVMQTRSEELVGGLASIESGIRKAIRVSEEQRQGVDEVADAILSVIDNWNLTQNAVEQVNALLAQQPAEFPPIITAINQIVDAWLRMQGEIGGVTAGVGRQASSIEILRGTVTGVQQSWDMVSHSVEGASSAVDVFIAKTTTGYQELLALQAANLAAAKASVGAGMFGQPDVFGNAPLGSNAPGFPTYNLGEIESMTYAGPGAGYSINPDGSVTSGGAWVIIYKQSRSGAPTSTGSGKFAPGSGSRFAPDYDSTKVITPAGQSSVVASVTAISAEVLREIAEKYLSAGGGTWTKEDVDRVVKFLSGIQDNTSQLLSSMPDALGQAIQGSSDDLIKLIQSEVAGGASLEDIQRELMARGLEAEIDAEGSLRVTRSISDAAGNIAETMQRSSAGIGALVASSQDMAHTMNSILAETIKSSATISNSIGALQGIDQAMLDAQLQMVNDINQQITAENKAREEFRKSIVPEPGHMYAALPEIPLVKSVVLPGYDNTPKYGVLNVNVPQLPAIPSSQSVIPQGMMAPTGTTVNLYVDGNIYQQSLMDHIMSELRNIGLRAR